MSMNNVTITTKTLVVEPIGLSKLWSFRRRVQIPLEHVRGARFDPDVKVGPRGWRAPGLRLPGKLAGTFRSSGRTQFWNTSGHGRTVVVTLDPTERFDRLVLTVADPNQVVTAINAAVGARGRPTEDG
jgi:hypothetical protein